MLADESSCSCTVPVLAPLRGLRAVPCSLLGVGPLKTPNFGKKMHRSAPGWEAGGVQGHISA